MAAALLIAAPQRVSAEAPVALPEPVDREVDFEADVHPILADKCYECHGPERQRSGLRLDDRDAALKGGDTGPAIIPGDSAGSPLIHLTAGFDPYRMMPPRGDPVTPEQLGVLRAWIDQGASYGDMAPAPAAVELREARLPEDIDPLYEFLLKDPEQRLVHRRQARLARVPPPPLPPEVAGPTHNAIDQFIVARWEADGLPQAEDAPLLCSDETFLRRVYLDVIGRIPTLAEARAFLDDPSSDKRERLIDDLLARDEEYAAHWTPFWEEALTSSPFAVVGGIPSRGNHKQWIFESFRDNKPYDVMVAELLDPKMPGHRPTTVRNINGKETQIGFLLNSTHTDTIQTAANVGQVFLGTGMKCASCHSHFENPEWPQERFIAFAGLFAEEDLELVRCEQQTGRVIPAEFAFEIPGVPPVGPRTLEDRLHYLTLLLTDPTNPRFAATVVNRLWKRYVGLALVEPVDDFREDSPPSHPELLDWLAYDFMANGYDLKHTIRLILTSRTYQLRYDPELEDTFDVARRDEPRYYRSPSLRRLTAEQYLDSVRLAKQQDLADGQRLYHTLESTALTRALGRPASRNEVSTTRADDVAVVQTLELLNGRDMHALVYSRDALGDRLERLPPDDAVNTAYLAVLTRRPTDVERALGIDFLNELPGRDAASSPPMEIVWIDDDLPDGATLQGTRGAESWSWVSAPDHPVFSGARSHRFRGKAEGPVQHLFIGAASPLTIEQGDVLFAHVYLDPADPPRQIMLQWNDGSWEHRAFWGEDLIPFGEPYSASRRSIGSLPEAGAWARLEVPAAQVDLRPGARVMGMSFDQVGGVVYWDRVGVTREVGDGASGAIRDLLWVLFTKPESQYIR